MSHYNPEPTQHYGLLIPEPFLDDFLTRWLARHPDEDLENPYQLTMDDSVMLNYNRPIWVDIDGEDTFEFTQLDENSSGPLELVGLFIPLQHQPEPFKAVYRDLDAMVDELKDSLGVYLPEDFNYRHHIGRHRYLL